MSPEMKVALARFEINSSRTLSGTGRDAVDEILPMIHGIATLMEVGFRKDEDGSSLFESYNPELIASAFAGLGYLAAIARFHAQDL